MATGTKAYIEDKDGNNILPATDWSIVQNKPTNLATTDQLPTLGPWQRDGIVYKNGAYDWDLRGPKDVRQISVAYKYNNPTDLEITGMSRAI